MSRDPYFKNFMINQSQNNEVMTSSGIDQVIPNSKTIAAEVIASFSVLEAHHQVIEHSFQPFSLEMAVIDVHPNLVDEYNEIVQEAQELKETGFGVSNIPSNIQLNLLRLTYSMNCMGQATPIMVVTSGDRYQITDGLYRLVVSRDLLGWTQIQAITTTWRVEDIPANRVLSRITPKRTHFEMAQFGHELRNRLSELRGKKRTAESVQQIIPGIQISEQDLNNVNGLVCMLLGLPFGKTTLDDLLYLYNQVTSGDQELREKQIFELLDSSEISISRAANELRSFLKAKVKRDLGSGLPQGLELVPVDEDDPNHRIILGDAKMNHDKVADNSVNLILTSFEYLNDIADYDGVEDVLETLGKLTSVQVYTQEVVEWCRLYRSKLTKDGNLAMIVSESIKDGRSLGIPANLIVGMMNDGWTLREDIIWQKTNNRFQSTSNHLQPAGEHILVFSPNGEQSKFNEPFWYSLPPQGNWGFTSGKKKDGFGNKKKYLKKSQRRLTNLIQEQTMRGVISSAVFSKSELQEYGETTHPCPYPFTLACLVILLYTDQNDLVLDFGAGIGSTAHAAKILKRRSISIELRSNFFDYLKNRMKLNSSEVLNEDEVRDIEHLFSSGVMIGTEHHLAA